MKKGKIITALVLAMALGIGATAYAAAPAGVPGQRLGVGRITSMRGYDYITSILKNKLGLSDKDITDALRSGKTPYDLATEKGMTQERLKTALLEEKTKAIDEAVSKGTITKEEGENLKANLKLNIESCTGNFGQRQGLGQGRGMMGNGQGRGCLVTPDK